jgi:hypothetical protein
MTSGEQQEGLASLIAASNLISEEVEVGTVVSTNLLKKDSVWDDSNVNTRTINKTEPYNAFKAIKSAFKAAVKYSLTTIVVYSGGGKGLQINCSEDGKQSRGKCKCSLHIVARRVRIDYFA